MFLLWADRNAPVSLISVVTYNMYVWAGWWCLVYFCLFFQQVTTLFFFEEKKTLYRTGTFFSYSNEERILNCTFEFQCLCCYGFCIRKDFLTLFMTGGKIIFGLTSRESEILGDTIKIFMWIDIMSWEQDNTSIMLIRKEPFIKSIGIGIQEGIQSTIIIFTMSTRTRVSTGEVRKQVSCSKSIWMEWGIPKLDIMDTERRETMEGLLK